jgi:hypothetical protein
MTADMQMLVEAARRELIVWSPQGWRPKSGHRPGPQMPPITPPPLGPYWADLIEILIRDHILIHPRKIYPSAAYRPLTVDEARIPGKLVVTQTPTQGRHR